MSIDLFNFKPEKPIVSWDKQCAGLGMRLNRDTTKVYIVKYQLRGRQCLKTLCSTNLMSLEQARQVVLRVKVLARHGDDPFDLIVDCLGLMNKAGKAVTLAEFCDIYMERHAKTHKKSWKKDQSLIDRFLIPEFGKRQLSSISRFEISTLHLKIGKVSTITANRVVELLQVILKFAALWGFLPENTPNQARGIKMFKEVSRDRFVTAQEMPRLMDAILNHPDKIMQTAILLDLHLGLRTSELIALKWDYIDLEAKTLRIPDTKNGRPHVLPITGEVEKLLSSLPRFANNPYVLPGRFPNTHISRIDKAFSAIRRQAGLDDVRPHDLRRTAGSWLNNNGANLHMIGRVLNQTTAQVTAVYARHGMDPVRDVLSNHSQQLDSIMTAVQQ